MLIIPAIDLIQGKCVRLTEGEFDNKKEYSNNPVEIAKIFEDSGAKRIHVVDLDGAKSGKSINREIIKKIKKETGLIIETGGGIRKEEDIKELIDSGIDYLILGSILAEDISLVEKWISKYKETLLAGIDAKHGKVKTKGWQNDEGIDAIEFGKKMLNIGFKTAIFTDISRDGKLEGANIQATLQFSLKTGLNVILSGGVSTIDDIDKAYKLKNHGIIGLIIGKAYYEGKLDLKQIIKDFGE